MLPKGKVFEYSGAEVLPQNLFQTGYSRRKRLARKIQADSEGVSGLRSGLASRLDHVPIAAGGYEAIAGWLRRRTWRTSG